MILSLVFLGIGGYLAFTLYSKWDAEAVPGAGPAPRVQADVVEQAPPTYTYPAALIVENVDGRQLEISLVARSDTHIQFRREGESTLFTYPVEDLAEESRERVKNYAVTSLVDADAPTTEASSALSVEEMHIHQLQQAIDRIDVRLADLRRQAGNMQSLTDRRTAGRQIEALLREREAHEANIASRQ